MCEAGFKKSLKSEQQVNEQLTGVLKKVEGDAENVSKQINVLRERKEKLQDTYVKLKRSLEQTEEVWDPSSYRKCRSWQRKGWKRMFKKHTNARVIWFKLLVGYHHGSNASLSELEGRLWGFGGTCCLTKTS